MCIIESLMWAVGSFIYTTNNRNSQKEKLQKYNLWTLYGRL